MHAADYSTVPGGPLHTLDDVLRHVTAITAGAKRTLALYTPDLEPALYDCTPFIDAVTRLVLTRSHARVRVLIADPARAVRDGNRFVAIARRLTSSVDLRDVPVELRNNPAAFIVADRNASVFRPDATRWEGTAALDDLASAARHLQYFDAIWNAADAALRYPPHRG